MVAWLAQNFTIQHCYLVGSDDQRPWMGSGHCASLGLGQAHGQRIGGLSRQWRFVHPGTGDSERQAETFEQCAAVG